MLLLGSGGREHAIAHKLALSEKVEKLYVAPGNCGTALESDKIENIALNIEKVDEVVAFATKESIDLVVVGPENPLVLGVVDALDKAGIKCFGPTKDAAVIEASKAWSKDFMARHNIRTARYTSLICLNASEIIPL